MQVKECMKFESKLWQEQFNAMERAFKLEERKCLFVVSLFGIGGASFVGGVSKGFAYLYFLIPLVAVAFDVLILSQKYAIRRIGYFLSQYSFFELERDWEVFVDNHREAKLRIGAETFTILSFVTSFWLILDQMYDGNIYSVPGIVYVWFVLLLIFGVWAKVSRLRLLSNFDRKKISKGV